MLKLENITFSYDNETEALKNVTLNIEKGKKTLFLGENGSGKSTLFLIMNGLLKAQKGDIYFEGKKVKYKMKFLARKVGSFTMSFSDEVHLYAVDTDDEISVASRDLEMRIKSKRDASSDSSLANIKIAGGKLVPSFSKYSFSVLI